MARVTDEIGQLPGEIHIVVIDAVKAAAEVEIVHAVFDFGEQRIFQQVGRLVKGHDLDVFGVGIATTIFFHEPTVEPLEAFRELQLMQRGAEFEIPLENISPRRRGAESFAQFQ